MAGDKLAKALGYADGQMPMHAQIPGDYEPCDECAKGRICVVEVKPPKNGGTVRKIVPSGVMAMISEDIVKQWLSTSPERLERILKARIMCIDHETAGTLGLLEAAENKKKEQPDA
jgi:hypothetical protein